MRLEEQVFMMMEFLMNVSLVNQEFDDDIASITIT